MAEQNQDKELSKVRQKLIGSIKAGRFNYEKYLREKPYFGFSIMTQPVFASYGRIGYDVYIYDNNSHHLSTLTYDEETETFKVDGEPLEKYLDSEIERVFLSKLKTLLSEYNAEIDTVEVRVNGQKVKGWSYEDDSDNPGYTDDDIMVLAGDTL